MSESSEENTCVVCFKGVEIYSIGQCDHPVCFECSTRMRVLCLQNECPICRQDMPKVIFLRAVQPFDKVKTLNHSPDEKFKVAFAGRHEREAYDKLLAHECPECLKISPNFNHLRDHVRRVHQLNYCDLCVDNLKILTRERRCYNRRDLALHRRLGDEDDRSHRGHPICEFCDKRYVDNDELYRHLRRNHLFCHFCDADGYHHYYKTYEDLRHHFKNEHYMCEEGDCYLEKFTSVFRTDIDLKAHKASVHGKGLGKAGLKQARTLDIEFTLAPRPRATNQRHRYHQRDDEFEIGAVGGTDESDSQLYQTQQLPQAQPDRSLSFHQINTGCIEEFPALGGASQGPPAPSITGGGMSRKVTASYRTRGPALLNDENFPALGPESGPVAGASVSLRVNTERPAPPSSVSIQVSHPRFTTTVTSKNNYNYLASNFPTLDRDENTAFVSVTQPPATSGTVSSTSVQWSAKTSKQQLQSKQTETAKTPSQKRSNNAPLKSDDFPALAPKENKPPERIAAVANKPSPAVPVETASTSAKSKKKKSKSKISSTTFSDAGTNVKKKNLPPEPPPLIEQRTNEISQSSAKKKSKDSVSKQDQPIPTESAKKETAFNKKEATKPILVDESSFPVLGGKAPPPGFEAKWQVRRPPPGLEKSTAASGPPVTAPPPGFLPSNGAFPPLLELQYIPPPNFEERNSALVGKVIKAVGENSLKDFKDFSVGYRENYLSAQEYYDHCREVMGSEIFISLFPELLALLPDVSKQKELWPLYQKDKHLFEKSASGKKNMLNACVNCGQVLKTSDSREHSTQHARDNNFPVLNSSSSSQRKSNAWSK